MKFFAVIVALAFAALVSTQTPVITSCATPGTTDLIINSFTISPYPLCINQNVCATGTGTLLTD
ncbi:hypothetical protein BGZ59_004051, partial [Podila verticillata]